MYPGNSKHNLESVSKFVEEYGFTLLSREYINDYTKLILQDKEQYIYSVGYSIFKTNLSSKKFSKSNPFTIRNIKLWCKLNNKPFELISEEYNGASIQMKWKCLKENCGEIFESTWSNTSCDCGCPYCSNRKVGSKNNLTVTHPELIKEWHIDNIILPTEVTYGSTKKIKWICSKCGNAWKASINSRTRPESSGCSECIKSKLEKDTSDFLIDNNIEYISQYRFKDCRDKLPLPFDFYLPILNVCIETDGIQHEKPYKFFGGEKKFNILKKHDQIKTDYCLSNNIKLIRIPYSKIKKISEILKVLL